MIFRVRAWGLASHDLRSLYLGYGLGFGVRSCQELITGRDDITLSGTHPSEKI